MYDKAEIIQMVKSQQRKRYYNVINKEKEKSCSESIVFKEQILKDLIISENKYFTRKCLMQLVNLYQIGH